MVEVFFDDPEVIGGLVDLQEVGVGSIAEHIARVRRAVSRMHDSPTAFEFNMPWVPLVISSTVS